MNFVKKVGCIHSNQRLVFPIHIWLNLLSISSRYITSPTSIFWRVISVILAMLAVLSKETGIMAMVINISVAILNYVMENILVASQSKSSKKDSEKVVLNPITSKIRRKKRTAALTRISTDIVMVSYMIFFSHHNKSTICRSKP